MQRLRLRLKCSHQVNSESQPVDEPSSPKLTLMASVTQVLRLCSDMLHTRLALFKEDAAEAGNVIVRALLMAVTAVVLGLMTIAFSAVAILVYFWDSHRLLAAVSIPVLLGLGTILLIVLAKSSLSSAPRAFAATMQTLRQDRKTLIGSRYES